MYFFFFTFQHVIHFQILNVLNLYLKKMSQIICCSYKQAEKAAQVAVLRLREMGVKIFRPTDYYAEMVKSDQHMQKVNLFFAWLLIWCMKSFCLFRNTRCITHFTRISADIFSFHYKYIHEISGFNVILFVDKATYGRYRRRQTEVGSNS